MNPLFWITALGLYGGLHFYILRKGWKVLKGTGGWRVLALVVSLFVSASFIAGRVLLARLPGAPTGGLMVVGNIWLAAWIYLVLFTFLIDIIRGANALVPFFPRSARENPRRAARFAFLGVLAATALILVFGAVQAGRFKIRDLDIRLSKASGAARDLTIVLASDIHVNPSMRMSHLEEIVASINGLGPDLIILAGDVLNEDIRGPQLEAMSAVLRKLKAPYGVLGVLGNHEIYGGVERSLEWLAKSGIDVLVDRTVLVAEEFYVAGRMDSGHGFRPGILPRKPLAEVLAGVDRSHPLILVDHQPRNLKDAEQNGVDLQLSGHTHGGQIFPITIINSLIYEVPQGYARKGKTQYYVSSGVGNWGPPMRIGSTPEIVRIRVSWEVP
jgi:predicted MPP superfamily phosphohydrolase